MMPVSTQRNFDFSIAGPRSSSRLASAEVALLQSWG